MQTNAPTLAIREALMTACPDCLLHGQDHLGQAFTVVTLHSQHDPLPSLFRDLNAQKPVSCIDLHGVDLITPSFTRSLLIEVACLQRHTHAPAVLIGVKEEVLQGLCDMHAFLRQEFAVWAMDEWARPHVVGVLPDRLQMIVDLVLAQREVTALDAATQSGRTPAKKVVNRFSVYLQELYHLGIFVREKVPGGADVRRERGWTYRYKPAYSALGNREHREKYHEEDK